MGALDDRVPPHKSVEQVRLEMEKAGQEPPEVIMYPGVGHNFNLPGYRIVPGLFMNQVRFIRKAVDLD